MKKRKGIILAGGYGTRLYPITHTICKQLIPIYDKPMIYYPLSTLMLAGIQDILIISTPEAIPLFKTMLSNGNHIGLNIEYKIQETPNGIAQSFIIGEDFIGDDNCCLILGDNLFHGVGFQGMLKDVRDTGATIFGYYVTDPQRFGVVTFNKHGKIVSLDEKPKKPKSNYAITGLYFYDRHVVEYAKSLKPSERGELEITDLNRIYLENGNLTATLFGRGFAWLDTGTHESLLEASNYVHAIQKCQGRMVSCIEEIAWRMGYINDEQLKNIINKHSLSPYYQYLDGLLKLKNIENEML